VAANWSRSTKLIYVRPG